MKKRRTSRPQSKSKFDLGGIVKDAKDPLLIVAGLFVGKQIGGLLDRNVTPAVSGLLGLDGETSKLIKPLVLTGGGLILSRMVPNQAVKMVSYGIAGYGMANLAESLLKVNVLSGTDDDGAFKPMLPGVGSPELPNLPTLVGDDEQPIQGDGDYQQVAVSGDDNEFIP